MLKIRVDDFLYTKENEKWRHNLDNFKLFDAVMEKHDCEYILGVIPKNTTSQDLDYLSSNPRVKVALHGILHDETQTSDGRLLYPNEFRDHQTQRDIELALQGALGLLNPRVGERVEVYIPPHNVLDPKTCRALKNLGFSDVFVGPGFGSGLMNGYGMGIDSLPESGGYRYAEACELFPLPMTLTYPPFYYGRSDELLEKGAAQELKKYVDSLENRMVTFHWTWELNIGLDNLDKFLTAIYGD